MTLATRKYAWKYVGNIAFWIQRLTGVALVGYLILIPRTKTRKNWRSYGPIASSANKLR